MCGRISQYLHGESYFHVLRLPPQVVDESELAPAKPMYNVPPGTRRRVIASRDGRLVMSREHWGYRGHAPRMYVNAKVETAAKSRYWGPLWRDGRVIVPADGWYEWTGEKQNRVPHFIRAVDGQPLMLAAISAPEGFVILTDAADAGLLDIHDRRPVALSADDAQAWLDPIQTDAAEEIAARRLDADAFTWYTVPKAVGNAHNDDPSFIQPLQP